MFPCVLRYWPIFSLLDLKFISKIYMTLVYGDLGDEALIVTKDGMVYGLGKNASGCLGIGDTHSTLYPKKIDTLCKKDIKTFAHGKGPHVLALTESGEVYSWGYHNPEGIPTRINFYEKRKIVQIACASYYSLALTDDGQVYVFGAECYRIGKITSIPKKVELTLNGTKVVSISCGHAFSLAVTDNGKVYSWGDNKVGVLGIENCNDQSHPCKVKNLTGVLIEKVACGYMHVLALSDEGVLYVWGSNYYGQLGCITFLENVFSPKKLEVPEMGRVLDIAASNCNHISVAMGIGNQVYIWGQCLGQRIKVPTLTPLRCLHDAFACYGCPSVMHQPLILHDDDEINLTNSLREAFDDPITSDLIIEVQGKQIHVHKALLKMRSHYFRMMFEEHWVENSQSVIKHEQYSYDTYKTFLKYLYTNEIDLLNNVSELLDLANEYMENQFKRHCFQLMKERITVTDVAFLYDISIKYDSKDLEEHCLIFALNHMTEVIQSPNFAKLDGSTAKMFIIQAARAGDLGNEALIVTKDGMVYGLGKNASGCLGTGDTHSTLYPKKIDALCKKDIKTFAHGIGPHVLALTERGEVYSWGNNDYHQLGNGTGNKGLNPILVGLNLRDKVVVQIACGNHHSLALTDDGEVYAWGANNCGQAGSSICTNQNGPLNVLFPSASTKVISISCGPSLSMAVSDNGKIYGWGCNTGGQLGIGNTHDQTYPCQIEALVGIMIEKVVCGYAHTLALSKEGVLYVWGENNFGQLGLGHKMNASSPVKLEVPEMGRVVDVATSHYNHISVAVGKSFQIFMWGLCLGQIVTVPTVTRLAYLHDVFACYATPRIMHKPLILHDEEGITSLVDSVREAFNDATTSDTVVEVQGKSIYVHKAILKIRCQYFRTMFEKVLAEDNQIVINEYHFSYDAYKAFLEYLYTDEINLHSENLLELLELASTYSESLLKKRCMQMIKNGITVNDVIFLYGVATENNIEELEESCFKFALNHMTAVVRTPHFVKLNENAVKTFITKAAEAGAFKT
ncbi:RCC1 and BTB domain-containing protein 1 [Habropoda laboriosa]|uniref:RCC1 and BTB domain-containing protein 1 n=1 Tax=Habropoda laboriosa TaxID=597456 RepID=A0A0L7QVD2_9HYME|nr:RCC1 and BTB domain-containing protein 1 [Habropoda laboriosa]